MKGLLLIALLSWCCSVKQAQAQAQRLTETAIIGFWNVENLYDTLNDPHSLDDEFTPGGANKWTGERYRRKLLHLAEVIVKLGPEAAKQGPALMGLCEVENATVLRDLINTAPLAGSHYSFVLVNGRDPRGIDPALLYDTRRFSVGRVSCYNYVMPADSTRRTRHVLLVRGDLMGEKVAVLVNHWPSRRGGQRESQPNRMAAARTVRRVCDSLMKAEPALKILLMGDFNDDPNSPSMASGLRAQCEFTPQQQGAFFNPMCRLHNTGLGSLAYRDKWNLFDQILLDRNWISGSGWNYISAAVFQPVFLRNAFGRYKGYPLRTYSGPLYLGGYSDHYPVYIAIGR